MNGYQCPFCYWHTWPDGTKFAVPWNSGVEMQRLADHITEVHLYAFKMLVQMTKAPTDAAHP